MVLRLGSLPTITVSTGYMGMDAEYGSDRAGGHRTPLGQKPKRSVWLGEEDDDDSEDGVLP